MNMPLPQSGRVVVIDDNYNEVEAIIKMLSQQRISVTYFSGKLDELPEQPFPDVRIIFLDVVLSGLTVGNTTIVSALMGVLGKIVNKNNGPFVVVLWTKHPDHIEGLKNALQNEGYKAIIIDLEKTDFFEKNGSFKSDSYTKLKQRINGKLKEIDIFKIFIHWENVVNDAASRTVNNFSQLSEFKNKDEWNKNIKSIFNKMAEAWAGKTFDTEVSEEIIRNALFTFNGIFEDTFENLIQSDNSIPEIVFSHENVMSEVVSKINTRLLLDFTGLDRFNPGNIYIEENVEEILKDIMDINETQLDDIKNNSIPIFAEITPLCDFLQDKMKLSRIIKGVLLPENTTDNNGTNIWKKIKKSDFVYTTPQFYYEDKNKLYKLVLDFKYFSSKSLSDIKNKKPIFRLRKDILNEIQIKLSSHISRTGVLFLD